MVPRVPASAPLPGGGASAGPGPGGPGGEVGVGESRLGGEDVAVEPAEEVLAPAADDVELAAAHDAHHLVGLGEAADADVTLLADALGYDTRIGRRFLNAGLGFGGGCLPKDIRAFMARAGELGANHALTFLREVDSINMRRRTRMVELTTAACGGSLLGANIAVLGAAFKPESDDVRDSPALNVAGMLQLNGATVNVYDPKAMDNSRRVFPTLNYSTSVIEACDRADAVLVARIEAAIADWQREQGEEYRNSLIQLVEKHGIGRNVRFNNKYLTLDELVTYLSATDIYVTPYLNKDQITSGTLAYAIGCGKAIISTPYLYAEEMLGEGRGILTPFRDSEAMSKALMKLLDDVPYRHKLETATYKFGRRTTWYNVAIEHLNMFHRLTAPEANPAGA